MKPRRGFIQKRGDYTGGLLTHTATRCGVLVVVRSSSQQIT